MSYVSYKGKVLDKVRQSFKDAVLLVGVECTKQISKNQAWDGFADIRDIVDTGQLRASQKIVFLNDTGPVYEAEIQYNTEYAAPVHQGATIRYRNGNVRRIVGRPWIKKAVSRVDVGRTMSKLLRK